MPTNNEFHAAKGDVVEIEGCHFSVIRVQRNGKLQLEIQKGVALVEGHPKEV